MAPGTGHTSLPKKSATVATTAFKTHHVQTKDLTLRKIQLNKGTDIPVLQKDQLPVVIGNPVRASLNTLKVEPFSLNVTREHLLLLVRALKGNFSSAYVQIQGQDGFYHSLYLTPYMKMINKLLPIVNDDSKILQDTAALRAASKLTPVLRLFFSQLRLKQLPSVMTSVENHHNRALNLNIKTQLKRLGFSPYRNEPIHPNRTPNPQHTQPSSSPRTTDTFLPKRVTGLVSYELSSNSPAAEKTKINLIIPGEFFQDEARLSWADHQSVQAQLISERFGGSVSRFEWSGKTRDASDNQTVSALVKLINDYDAKGVQVNIFAHGSGGILVQHALSDLKQTASKHTQENLITPSYHCTENQDNQPPKLNFLALFAAPLTAKAALTKNDLIKLTNYFVSVSCSQDLNVPPEFGLSKNTLHREADFILNLTDASYDNLVDFVVLNQLRDPTLPTHT